ncbi:MAG: hypothetical protein LBU60_02770 [Clostridiales bacterium]|jgi:hypothetical protein|nr:hypothetical protein [Clostridiales bacterium]
MNIILRKSVLLKIVFVVVSILLSSILLTACSTLVSANKEQMITLKTVHVYPISDDYSFGTIKINSKSQLQEFLEKQTGNFQGLTEDYFLKYSDKYFEDNILVLYGAMKDINTGVTYQLKNGEFSDNNILIEIIRVNPGGNRVITYNILLFDIAIESSLSTNILIKIVS